MTKWTVLLVVSLLCAGPARAEGPDDQYLDIYNTILLADSAQQNGFGKEAATDYLQAQRALTTFKTTYPAWNPEVINFRLDYTGEQLQKLQQYLPGPKPATVAAQTSAAPAAPAAPTAPTPDVKALHDQIQSLTAANTDLENRLKEALSVQPAAISPAELKKAQERILVLEKERDLLKVAVENAKLVVPSQSSQPESDKVGQLKKELAAREKELAVADKQHKRELQGAQAALKEAQDKAADLQSKLDAATAATKAPGVSAPAPDSDQVRQLREQLAAREKELAAVEKHPNHALQEARAALKEAQDKIDELQGKLEVATAATRAASVAAPAPDSGQVRQLREQLAAREKELAAVEKHPNRALQEARAALKVAQDKIDELQGKLEVATAATKADQRVSHENPPANPDVEQLHARLAVLEAQPVPYTAEELALLKQSPQAAPAQLPPATAPKRVSHSKEELPPGAGALMSQALRAVMERNFPDAESKMQEILRQDENNVYVLAYLANAQLAQNHLDECEKTVQRALKLDPEDPATLYLLGVLRYQQSKYDEALDALSRSAQLNSTNSSTENYLGCVLVEKGQRGAAETALRKAVQFDPVNPEAHYNLAFVYATGKPPSPQLAAWHYQRAITLGHAKDPALEKLLPAAPASTDK